MTTTQSEQSALRQGAIFLPLFLILYYTSIFFASEILNLTSLLACLIFLLSFVKKEIFCFNFPYLFSFSTTSIVIFLSEFGAYFSEIDSYSSLTGVTARAACLFSIFIFGFALAYSLGNKKYVLLPTIHGFDRPAIWAFIAISFLCILASFFTQATYGFPLLNGWDRFYYWANVAPSYHKEIHLLIISSSLLFSYAYYSGIIQRWLLLVWLFSSAVALLLASEKFSGFFGMILYWLPAMIVMGRVRLSIASLSKTGFILLSLLLISIGYNYTQTRDGALTSMLADRVSLQAQMGWALDNLSDFFPKSVDVIATSFLGFTDSTTEKGMTYLMYLIAPADLVDRFVEGGVRFTAPFPANVTFFYGFLLAPIIVFIVSFLPGLVASACRTAIIQRNFTYYFISLKFSMFLFVAIIMGEQHLFFSAKFAIYFFAIFITPLLFSICSTKIKRTS